MSVHNIYITRLLKLSIFCLLFCIFWACSNKQQSKYVANKALSFFNQGKNHEERGVTDSAIFYYRASIDLLENNDTSTLKMKAHQQLGSILFLNGYYDRSIKNFQESNKIARNLGDSLYSSFTFRKIGISHFFKNDLDSALFFFQQAYKFNLHLAESEETSSLYNNFAAVYAEKGEYETAMRWNEKALSTSKNEESLGHNYAQRSNLCLSLNKIDSATYYSLLCVAHPDPYVRVSSLETLYMIKSMQHSSDSIKYYTELSNLNDSLWKANKAVEIAEAEAIFEQQKIDQLSSDKRNVTYFLLGAGILVVILVIYSHQRVKAQKNATTSILKPVNDSSTVSSSASTVHEIQHISQEKDPERAIGTPGETLLNIQTSNELLIKKGEMLAELFQNSLAYQKFSPKIIQDSNLTFQEQINFITSIEKTFDSFLSQLSDLCKLTKEEGILCCLYLIGFSNRECAACKNVSENAIRTQKSRIKAKMTDNDCSRLFTHIFKKRK